MISELMIGVRNTFVLWVITAIFYPVLLLIIGQVAFPYQANGSLIKNAQGEIIGSALIGQSFTSERYFWSRPSTINYSQGEDSAPTGISGASNLAPSNPDLITRIQQEITRLQQAGIEPTADLVYTSGSGLDPHITQEAAQVQVARVAQARSISPEEIQELIVQNTDKRFLVIFGEPGVNVLKLNWALDKLS
ncbi:MAG: K(+)-transporting ATPase subunit C [Limnoraphis sp. WC205]|jgi:K+-transporting ATPase ATPase C chain|nr:K(+)-transporting ATPase subunit C [Limnoraphis sp. WC205]